LISLRGNRARSFAAVRQWLSFLFVVVGVSLAWSSCAPRAPLLEPVDLPVSPVVGRLEARRASLSSFRAAGTIGVEGAGRQWSGRAFFLAELPRRLRLELLSFFGQPVLYVVSDGKEAVTWAPGQQASRGFDLGRVIESFSSIPLGDDEVMLLLAGCAPEFSYREAKLFRDVREKAYVLQLEDPSRGEIERLWLEDDAATMHRLERLQAGGIRLDAVFSEFANAEGFSYPQEVKIEAAGLQLTVRYQVFIANETLPDKLFHLQLPPGVEVSPQ
jgi:outer membrane lipoprotein-sorting protein